MRWNMDVQNKEQQILSTQVIKRMPYYLQYLKKLYFDGAEVVSAPTIAAHFNYTEIQVRKDFSAISSTRGKPKSGFSVKELIQNMEQILGYNSVNQAVLVGAGQLGRALLTYRGFDNYGLKIVAAFDSDEAVVGSSIAGKAVLSADKISVLCLRMNIRIGIITVPEDQAQLSCDQLIAGGVQAIWNFAPVHLSVPSAILVQNENMAASLAMLSKHLQEKIVME